MDKKSKILIWAVVLLIFGSVAVTYWKIFIQKDYIITAQADCDPAAEACFTYLCDPEVEECTGDPEEDTWYYKVINRKAANIPLCDPKEESCEALICPEGEEDCEVVYCEPGNADEIECTNPADFPVEAEEDAIECEEGDEECLSALEAVEEIVCEEGNEECELTTEDEDGEEEKEKEADLEDEDSGDIIE